MAAKKKTNEKRNDYPAILITLAEIKKDTEAAVKRLDKINGCIDEYNNNKHKMDENRQDILDIRKDLKDMSDDYMSKKLIIALSIILGVIVAGSSLVQYFWGI